MREKPISNSIEEANDLKTLHGLANEMKELLLKLLKVDKRSLRKPVEKELFRARVNLYCKLYKRCRVRFMEIQKRDGTSVHFKAPLEFEELLKDFNWEKSVKYSRPVKKKEKKEEILFDDDDDDFSGGGGEDDDEDEDEIDLEGIDEIEDEDEQQTVSKQTLVIQFLNEIEQIMAKLFDRNNKDVQADALKETLITFVLKYEHLTTPEILKDAYEVIRAGASGKTTEQKVEERVGKDETTQPLETREPGNGEVVQEKQQRVRFKHAGGEHTGAIKEETETHFYIVGDDGINYPTVGPDDVLELLNDDGSTSTTTLAPTTTTTTTVKEKKVEQPKTKVKEVVTTIPVELPDDEKPFKTLEKSEKYDICEKYWDAGIQGCAAFKKKLIEDGYDKSLTYDDVFYTFEKVKAAKKKAV